MDHSPLVDQFLTLFPPPMAELANSLRRLVRRAVPDSIERIRMGWRLIGYDVPVGRRRVRYFAYVAPELEHVHLGFEHGVLLDDPAGLLHGAHLRLRKVRYLTYRPAEAIPEREVIALIEQAAQLAAMPRADLSALALSRDL